MSYEPAVIEEPAFVSIQVSGGMSIRGRFVRYADPTAMGSGVGGMTTAWFGEDREGTRTFIPWGAILMLTAFPLSSDEAKGAKPGIEVTEPEK